MHKAAARAATAPPPPKTRSYDDIEREIEEDPLAGGGRKKVAFPEGDFVTRQRVNTPGERRLRYQGRAVRVYNFVYLAL